jgi:hypothetical protein
MAYAFVKKAKIGELAEGENPMMVIRVSEEALENYLNPVQAEDEKWELATEEEWKEDGETVLGETQEDGSVVTSDGEVMSAEEVVEAAEVLAKAEAELESVDESEKEEAV